MWTRSPYMFAVYNGPQARAGPSRRTRRCPLERLGFAVPWYKCTCTFGHLIRISFHLVVSPCYVSRPISTVLFSVCILGMLIEYLSCNHDRVVDDERAGEIAKGTEAGFTCQHTQQTEPRTFENDTFRVIGNIDQVVTITIEIPT